MTEKFYHFRLWDNKFETWSPKGGVTVCLLIDFDLIYGAGVAVCSLQDQFNHKIGRDLAQRRAWGKCDRDSLLSFDAYLDADAGPDVELDLSTGSVFYPAGKPLCFIAKDIAEAAFTRISMRLGKQPKRIFSKREMGG